MVADATDRDPGGDTGPVFRDAAGAVAAVDAILLAAFKEGMLGDNIAEIEDADQIGQLLHLDDTTGAVWHTVIVAADRDEAVVAHAAFELQHGVEAMLRQRLQLWLLGIECLGDDALGRAVDPDVGDGVEPVDQLAIQIVEIAKAAAEEEVLPDIAEGSLDLALGFGPIRTTGPRLEAIMRGQRQERAIVDDVALIVLAGHCRLHAVIEDFDRHTAKRCECLHVTAQQRLQVLMHDVSCEDEARMPEHEAEQPDDTTGAGIVGEVDDETGEVDLGLYARRRFEAHLVRLGSILGADRSEVALHRGIGADIAELTYFTRETGRAEIGKGSHALPQEVHVGRQLAWPTHRTRPVDRRLDAALDIFAHGLRVAPRPPGDGGDRDALSMQFQNHHQLSKSNHRRPLAQRTGRRWRLRLFPPG